MHEFVDALFDDPREGQLVPEVTSLYAVVSDLQLLQFLVSLDALQVCVLQPVTHTIVDNQWAA